MTGTRKFIPHVDASTIVTPFGTMYATPTGRNHVSITTMSSLGGGIVINGVSLSVHIHLYRDLDGTWSHETFYARRNDNFEVASDAARRKIANGLIPLLVTWCDDNADLFNVAERGRLSNEVLSAGGKLDAAHTLYHAAMQAYAEALDDEGTFAAHADMR